MAQSKKDYPVRNLIIGRVVASPQDTKTTVGYAIITFNDHSSNFLVTSLPVRTVISKILLGEIENASVVQETSVITLLGVNEKDLPLTLANQTEIPVSDKVFVLDRVVKKVDGVERSVGFRVFTYSGIVIIPADKLIAAHKSKQIISINAKVVNRDGKDIISSKRGNFGVILAYVEEDKKSSTKENNVISSPKDTGVDIDERKKHNKVKFRKKAVEYFLYEFATRGRISKITTQDRAKKAKVALNEFFVKKYPVLKELKDFNNNLILEAGVVLHLSNSKEAFDIIVNRPSSYKATANYLLADLDYDSANALYTILSDEKLNVLPVVLEFLDLRNKVIQKETNLTITEETHLLVEDLIEEISDYHHRNPTKEEKEAGVDTYWGKAFYFITKEYLSRFKKIKNKSLKKLRVRNSVLIKDIPFTEPRGFNYMGYSLLGDDKVGSVEKTVYGDKKLRSMFNLGIPNLRIAVPSNVQKDIIANIKTFGDAELVRSLLLLKFASNNNISYSASHIYDWSVKRWGTEDFNRFSDSEYITHEMNIRLAVLAQYNYHLAVVMNDYLDEVATFSLRDAESYLVGDGDVAESKVFYQSGMKFNNPNEFVGNNKTWGRTDNRPALNAIPPFTYGMLKSLGLLNKETDYLYDRYCNVVDRLKDYCKE